MQLKLQSSKIVTLFIKLISWLNTSFFWYISTYFNYADWTFWRCLSIVYCNLLAREEFWNSSKVLFIAIFWHNKSFETPLRYCLLQSSGTTRVFKLLQGIVYCNLLAREEFWNSSKVLFIAIFWHDKSFETPLRYCLLQSSGTTRVLKLL